MLRMVLLGLFILLGVGMVAAMEFRATPRSAAAVVQPVAERAMDISDSHDALAKADRLEIAAASSETPAQPAAPAQPAPADENISPSEGVTVGSSEPPRVVIHRHRLDPKPTKVATATHPKSTAKSTAKSTPKSTLKSTPKAADAKRSTISERSKAASNAEPCRLSAFGGLRKALNTADCQI